MHESIYHFVFYNNNLNSFQVSITLHIAKYCTYIPYLLPSQETQTRGPINVYFWKTRQDILIGLNFKDNIWCGGVCAVFNKVVISGQSTCPAFLGVSVSVSFSSQATGCFLTRVRCEGQLNNRSMLTQLRHKLAIHKITKRRFDRDLHGNIYTTTTTTPTTTTTTFCTLLHMPTVLTIMLQLHLRPFFFGHTVLTIMLQLHSRPFFFFGHTVYLSKNILTKILPC